METGLKIIIGADASGVEKAFVEVSQEAKKAVDAFSKVDVAAAKTAGSFDKVAAATPKVTQGASAMVKTVTQAGAALDKTAKTSSSATQSLVNLSRVAQDAPYGFIGIANNLNPLLEGFQRLRQEAGSNGAALKALGSSLIGPAGIGLAIGVISSLLVVFGDRLFKSTTAVDKQKEAVKKAKEQLDDYAESLSDVQKVDLFGTQNAQEELVKLKALYDAATNLNIPIAQRKKLVDELQSQYPTYFANFSDEIILAGGAKAAYDKLTTSILASGRARAGIELVVQKQKDLLNVEKQLADAQAARATAGVKNNQVEQRNKNLLKGNPALAALDPTINRAAISSTKELEAAEKRVNDLLNQRFELHRGIASIQNKVNEIAEQNPDGLLKPGAKPTLPKATGEDKKKAYEFLFEFLPFDPNGALKPENKAKLIDAIDKYSKEFGSILQGADFRVQPGVIDDNDLIETAKAFWEDLKKGIIKLKPQNFTIDATLVPEIKAANTANLDALIRPPEGPDTGAFDLKRDEVIGKYAKMYGEIGMALPDIVRNSLGKKVNISSLGNVELEKALEKDFNTINDFLTSVTDAKNRALQTGFEGIGEGIATAIEKQINPLQAIGNSILQTVGDFITQIGKALIKYGIIKTGLDKVLKAGFALPGAAAIAIGIGAVAIGQLIKATKPRAFAEGGIAYGPTMGLVGEYSGAKNNPEVIAPLNKLKSLLGDVGGGNFSLSGEFKIKGDDLVFAYQRNARRQGRNF
jgi:hypothetical protein